jgi:hypothetical protein
MEHYWDTRNVNKFSPQAFPILAQILQAMTSARIVIQKHDTKLIGKVKMY